MLRQTRSNTKQDLDRLMLRWVMAKNRNQEALMSTGELCQLVRCGYLTLDRLSREVRDLVVAAEPDLVKLEKVKMAHQVVNGLMGSLDEIRNRFYDDVVWATYDESSKRWAKEQIFKQVFGLAPKEYGFNLYELMA